MPDGGASVKRRAFSSDRRERGRFARIAKAEPGARIRLYWRSSRHGEPGLTEGGPCSSALPYKLI